MKKRLNILTIPILAIILFACFVSTGPKIIISAAFESDLDHKSAVLVEQSTGKILYENNSNDRFPIASVTKLMTILLTLERIETCEISLEDKIIVSANASGMGGSQIFLENNGEYKLRELLKSVIVASANDSSVALAEYISGSENNFVRLMNERANELNLKNTNYANCTGLPSPEGYSSAYDQAIIISKVLKYDIYHTYSSIWMEDFIHPTGRTTMMTNTNKLSRFYDGCIGGKTGSTNEAKYCLAVGVSRNNVNLISVVLGSKDSASRFGLASELLNYGFANYESKTLFSNVDLNGKSIKIKGLDRTVSLKCERDYVHVCEKNTQENLSLIYHLPTMLTHVKENQIVGNVDIIIDGIVVDTISLLSAETYNEATLWDYIKEIAKHA